MADNEGQNDAVSPGTENDRKPDEGNNSKSKPDDEPAVTDKTPAEGDQ